MTSTETQAVERPAAQAAEPEAFERHIPVREIVIEPTPGWRIIDWRELYEYRDLFYFLVRRAIRVRYAQSALGIGWAIIQPLVTMVVFTVIFGRLVSVPSDGADYAIFSFVALVPWTYFSTALNSAANSLVAEAGVISKIYFPRLILPFTAVLAKLVDFAIGLVLMIPLLLWYGQVPNVNILYLPLLIAIMTLTASGLGMWLAAMAIQYRDVAYALGFVIQILMYASPVIYAASAVPEAYQVYYGLNPMAGVIEGFRAALLGTRPMPWDFILSGTIVSLVLAVTGAYYFKRMEKVFADVA